MGRSSANDHEPLRDNRRDHAAAAGDARRDPGRYAAGRAVDAQDATKRGPAMKAAVLGSGSWGTAFAKVLADAGAWVTIWARRPEVVTAIREKRTNPEYLPVLRLPAAVDATVDAAEALGGADLVVFAVPAQTLRGNLATWVGSIGPDATLVSLIKGIELGTSKRMTEVIVETARVP